MNITNTLTVAAMLVGTAVASPHTALRFEKNLGQTDKSIQYVARAAGHSLLFTDTDAVVVNKNGASLRLRPAGLRGHAAVAGENAHPLTKNSPPGRRAALLDHGVLRKARHSVSRCPMLTLTRSGFRD